MFATIYVPDFALQAVLRNEPELRTGALAIVDDHLPARVRQMTAPAHSQGVVTRMTTTQALGRCPGLLFRTAEETAMAPASACLLQCAESVSPWLEATAEGVVTLEWRGVAPSKIMAAAQGVVEHLARCQFAARVGVAATPDLAWLAAQRAEPVLVVASAPDFLKTLPCSVLALEDGWRGTVPEATALAAEHAEILRALHRWGIAFLGELTTLPRAEVVLRLGPRAGTWWDRAAGRAQRLLRLTRAPEIFAEGLELEQEIETTEPLLFILQRFLEQIVARLTAVYRVAAILELELRFTAGPPHCREFRIPAPTADLGVLFRLLETHLESLRTEAPIIAVSLRVQPTPPEQKQFDLFASGLRDPHKFFATLARLQALLGENRLGNPVMEDTYRPDAFHLETPCFEEAPPAVESEVPLGPPLQRYRPPLPADVQVLEGRPRRIFSEKAFGEITRCQGPWVSSGDWWGARAWQRWEWDVQVSGIVYRLAQDGPCWFLDGAYD